MELVLEGKNQIHEDEIFYRYRLNEYLISFSQYQDNGDSDSKRNLMGNIYQVSILTDDNTLFELKADVNYLTPHISYPTTFRIINLPYEVKITNIEDFESKFKYAKKCLKTISQFFRESEHHKLWVERIKRFDF